MKLTIQSKLLLPSLTALVIMILGSTLLVANMVSNRLESNFENELEVTNQVLQIGRASKG